MSKRRNSDSDRDYRHERHDKKKYSKKQIFEDFDRSRSVVHHGSKSNELSGHSSHHGEAGSSNRNTDNFEYWKRDLDEVLSKCSISDKDEFWKFLRSYMTMQKKAQNRNEIFDYKKTDCVPLTLCGGVEKLYTRLNANASLTLSKFKEFCDVICLYLDFRQREKFSKLVKLRECQKNLPITQYKEDIVKAVQENRVVIVAGDTGCGKSTQVPQYLLNSGFKCIACTQPRRIACIALCKRVSYETLDRYGREVGYQIRFEKSRSQDTRILFITEGLLLRQVPGRLHPIKLKYCPISKEDQPSRGERFNAAPYIRVLQLIDDKYPKDERGDVLMFLSGMSEISAVVEAAQEYASMTQSWVVLPLHSALSLADQDKVFDYPPEGYRKCVVATNIAETSITIDGIRFVVDSGKMKQMSFDPGTRMQRLKEFWVSQANAEQRKGRAGRTGPGVCFRLFSEEQYNDLEAFTEPEIHRVPLDSLILQMLALGLPDARQFPFLEAPPEGAIEGALLSLQQQGALSEEEQLTPMGKLLAALPVDVALGKLLLAGCLLHQQGPALALAAALSVQSPFSGRASRDPDIEAARGELESDHGDPPALLAALRTWLQEKQQPGSGARRWCKRLGLEEQRFFEMVKLQRQFRDLLQDVGLLNEDRSTSTPSTAAERAMRHGEMRLLHKLRREQRAAGPRKRRRLRADTWQLATGEDEEEPDHDADVRDVEFRLSHSGSQLQNLLVGASANSAAELGLLKLLVVSGLYPQLAVADEFNASKSVSEMLFHTSTKPFVALHPMSYFGRHPQVLQLSDADVEAPARSQGRLPLSSKHQLLCYMSLLETTKPYLMNTLRIPAAQSLLLFCQNLDTSLDFSRVVCDEWLELEFSAPPSAAMLLHRVSQLRMQWIRLLALKLDVVSRHQKQNSEDEQSESETSAVMPSADADAEAARLSAHLAVELPRLLHVDISYSISRLLAADRKVLFVGPGVNNSTIEPNPFLPKETTIKTEFQVQPHPRKGGMRVTPFLTYGCLEDAIEDPPPLEEWHCELCDFMGVLQPLQQLQHLHMCQPSKEEQQKSENSEENKQSRPNAENHQCPICKKYLQVSAIELLRHRRQCAARIDADQKDKKKEK
ncbi:ATP-dependent RNA helicase DHX8 [Gryllus bimaculatus]|nr:ATP-dependent RNA helicase DHX8 [Gryllus bimaculatus]